MTTVEVCIADVESAVASQEGGANSVELCDNLKEGGTTPSWAMIQLAREKIDIGLHVIIRPRGGDFCYSEFEFELMKRNVKISRELGADGVVFGILRPDGELDKERMAELVELAGPMYLTCHRAFDMSPDPYVSLETLIELGFHRILTSSRQASAADDTALLGQLHQQAAGRIVIMAGGRVRLDNVERIVNEAGVGAVHLGTGVSDLYDSQMVYRNESVSMGADSDEYQIRHTSADKVRQTVTLLRALESA
ncbi:copper homeostasis protein CutC [Anaerolineales bacterium HSG6]|nr:copper homeostasis protein CutC [Anaerolineales bacterium HSG6]